MSYVDSSVMISIVITVSALLSVPTIRLCLVVVVCCGLMSG